MISIYFDNYGKVARLLLPLFGKAFLLLSMFLLIHSPGSCAQLTAEVREVVDGDTIIANVEGVNTTIRYLLIDTPELHHPKRPVEEMARLAREVNAEFVKGKTVLLEFDNVKRDRYGRMLSYVWTTYEGENILVNEQIVLRGMAVPMTISPNDRYADRISRAFREARIKKAGLWSIAENRTFTAEQAWWELPYIEGKFFILDLKIRSIIQSGSRHVILPEKGNFSIVVYQDDWKECKSSIPEEGGLLQVLGRARRGYHGGELVLADPAQVLSSTEPK